MNFRIPRGFYNFSPSRIPYSSISVSSISYAKPCGKHEECETVQTVEQIHPHNFCSAAIQFYVILLFLEAFNQELICTRTEYALSTKFSGGLASGLDEYARSTGSPHQAVINQLSSSVCCHLFTSKFLCME